MFVKALACVSILFMITACGSTGGKTSVGQENGSADIADKYALESGGLDAFSDLPNSKVGAKAHDRVFFDYDSATLSSKAQVTLDKQVAWLKKNPEAKITVEGHCDERGTREYNLALGDRRANAVVDYLASSGITTDRITPISYGKERPAVVGSGEAEWEENRRAVSVLK
jgi:peptidoglycan-associated lipoprotein